MATKSRKSKDQPYPVIASNKRGYPLIDSTQPVALNDNSSRSSIKLRMTPFKKILGKFLILTGLLIIFAVIILTQIETLTPAKTKVYLPVSTQSQNPTPKSVQILNKTKLIRVKEGTFQDGKWELSDTNALYLASSGIPGKPGNIVIYGHNTENIFADLKKTKFGDQVQIETSSGKKLKFKVDTIKSVLPNNVEILKQGPDERITLYTCSGLLDSMRLVVSGILLIDA